MTFGALAVFYFGAGLLYGFVGSLLGAAAVIAGGHQSFQHIGALINEPVARKDGGSRPIRFQGEFILEHVNFAYGATAALEGVSLTIPAGSRVAIIGDNGSGKSTLLSVLLGLSAPTAGRVRADRFDYDCIDLPAFRRQIGVVLQQPAFFQGTVRENIAYGVPEANDSAVAEAVALAGARALIESLPCGYQTMLGEGGATLSGGEVQRLAIARALLRRPKALILDEPTNHLDVHAVRQLLDTFEGLPHKPTVVLVSHDMRVLQIVETTYVLERGRLRELERHEWSGASAGVTIGV
jgi:ABC-type bacteriocin/lantibiotic exporter with double-glycine peptidase domain